MKTRMKVYKSGKAAVSRAALVFVWTAHSSSKRYRIGNLTVARLLFILHLSVSIAYLLVYFLLIFIDGRTQEHMHLVIRSK